MMKIGVGILLCLSMMGITGCAQMNQVAKPKYEEYIASGDVLPIQTITTIDGEQVVLNATDKKKLVVLFATWCSDSNRALKALNESPLLNNENVEVIAIAREESNEVVAKWRDENNIKVKLASDPDRAIFKQFAAAGIPRLVTVDNNNQIIRMNLAEGDNQLDLIDWGLTKIESANRCLHNC